MKNSKTTKTGNSKGSKTRKKEYNKFKENHSKGSKGLGDTVEKITRATGIKAATDYVFDKLGRDCGCNTRRDKLNEIFRYEKPECFNEKDFNHIKNIVDTKKNKFTNEEQEEIVDIYTRVFPLLKRPECTPCSFKSEVYNRLIKVYNTYK